MDQNPHQQRTKSPVKKWNPSKKWQKSKKKIKQAPKRLVINLNPFQKLNQNPRQKRNQEPKRPVKYWSNPRQIRKIKIDTKNPHKKSRTQNPSKTDQKPPLKTDQKLKFETLMNLCGSSLHFCCSFDVVWGQIAGISWPVPWQGPSGSGYVGT